MLVGLYFGSFNPVHNGHLIIANHMKENEGLDAVWFIVSPQNPFKQESTLLNVNHRIHLIQIALDGETGLAVSNIEVKLPKPSYTINTLVYLRERFPKNEFRIIIGSDGFQNIDKWKNSKEIISNYSFLIYVRPGFEKIIHPNANYKIVDAPFLNISSTHIRYMIKNKKSIRFLVPDAIKDEIEKNGYYSSALENPTQQ
jgi:nicotinate-nucleotide adenylyltransferase